jgi:phospholipase C
LKYQRLALAAVLLGAATACAGPATQRDAGGAAGFVPAAVTGAPVGATMVSPSLANVVKDPGFEDGGAYWQQCGTVKAKFTTAQAHTGKYSELGGSISWPEINGTQAVCQTVTVPKNGRLQFWVRQDTDDQIKYAHQAAYITKMSGVRLKTLYREANETNGWKLRGPYDLSAFAGQKVVIEFEVLGTGYGTAFINQYVDDVSLTSGALPPPKSPPPSPIPGNSTPIRHVIIVLQENRTFDNIFHGFPGANYAKVGLGPNGNIPLHEAHLMTSWDPAHGVEDWRTEYNNGSMTGFTFEQLDGGTAPYKNFAYTYAMQSDVQPYWDLGKEGVVGDAMFASHRSQSYAGHLYPIAGASGPISPSLPDWYVADNPQDGGSCAEPGTGEAIDIKTGSTGKNYTSCFNFRTLGDLLDAKKVPWRYYVDSSDKVGQVSGYASIKHTYEGEDWADVVTPETTIFQDIDEGRLPAVSWVIGTYANSDHAGQTVPSSNGPTWVTSVFNAVGESKYWKDSVIILTYDDWGGWYDHVKPVTWNAYEPGFRLPLVIVSPYAKRGYVSHDAHYTGSILRFIEKVWGLGSLGTTDAKSDAFDDVFDFTQKPLNYIHVKADGTFQQLFETNLPQYGAHPQGADRD